MKTYLTSLLFLIAAYNAYSQTIEKFSIDSGGAISSNGGLSLIYTIGETTIAEPAAGNINLSSGFINGPFDVILAVNEVSESDMLIYPNPASESLHFKTSLYIEHLELYNTLGHKVMHQKNYAGFLDISTLKSGLYILKIITRDRELSKRILIND